MLIQSPKHFFVLTEDLLALLRGKAGSRTMARSALATKVNPGSERRHRLPQESVEVSGLLHTPVLSCPVRVLY